MKTFITLAALGALAIGCGDEIRRTVELTPAGELPGGTAVLRGQTLVIDAEPTEALDGAWRSIAWAISGTVAEALGEIDAEHSLMVPVANLRTPIDRIAEIHITEEAAGPTLPDRPSDEVWMKGTFPGALAFLGLGHEAVGAATAQAKLRDDTVEFTATGLPSLPHGFSYRVWMLFEDGGGHGGGDAMPMMLGQLGGGTFLSNRADRLLVTAHSVMVTIESEHGADTMSSAMVLRGEVLTTAPTTGATPPAAEPEEGGHTH